MIQILIFTNFKGGNIRQCSHLLHVPVLVVVPEHGEPIGSHDLGCAVSVQHPLSRAQQLFCSMLELFPRFVRSFQRAIFMTHQDDSLHCAAEPDMATAVELPPLQAGIIGSSIDIADGDSIQQHGGPLERP